MDQIQFVTRVVAQRGRQGVRDETGIGRAIVFSRVCNLRLKKSPAKSVSPIETRWLLPHRSPLASHRGGGLRLHLLHFSSQVQEEDMQVCTRLDFFSSFFHSQMMMAYLSGRYQRSHQQRALRSHRPPIAFDVLISGSNTSPKARFKLD